MSDYEVLCMEVEFLEQELAALQRDLEAKKALKLEMEETMAEADNPYWTDDGDDPYGARYNKQVLEIGSILANGDRADRYYYNTQPTFHAKIITTLAEDQADIPDWFMEMYSVEQNENLFILGWGGKMKVGYALTDPNIDEEGYKFLWGADYGPIKARKSMEAFWSAPGRLEQQREEAKRRIRWADFMYKMALRMNRGEKYLRDNPNYEPPED